MLFCPLMKLLPAPAHRADCSGCGDKIHTSLVIWEPSPAEKRARDRAAIEERMRAAKAMFLRDFESTLGIIKEACLKAGISRKTFYNWKNNDPEFAAAIEEIHAQQGDYVEDILLEHIRAKNLKAVTFWLNNKHPEYNTKKIKAEVVQAKTLEDLIDENRRNHAATAATVIQGVVLDRQQA